MKQIYLWASALCLALTAPLTANAQLQLVNESVVNAENEPAPCLPPVSSSGNAPSFMRSFITA